MTPPMIPGRRAAAVVLISIVAAIGCSSERPVRLADIRSKPGCYPPDSSYIVAKATLSAEGRRVPFSGGLVVRQLSQGTDTVTAIVPDTLPVGQITRRFHVQTAPLLGFVFGSPVLLLAPEVVQKQQLPMKSNIHE